jgi:hypothetical protein
LALQQREDLIAKYYRRGAYNFNNRDKQISIPVGNVPEKRNYQIQIVLKKERLQVELSRVTFFLRADQEYDAPK